MTQAIFFDLDDTLYSRAVPYGEAFEAFWQGKHPDLAEAAFHACMRRGDEVFDAAHRGQITMEAMHIYRHGRAFEDVGLGCTPEEALEFQALYARKQQEIHLSLVMTEILNRCREQFAAIGILSNGGSSHQRRKLRQLGMERWAAPNLVLISDEQGCSKPDPGIFALAEQAAGLPPEKLIMVGDSYEKDILPAALRGWQTIWFDRGLAEPGGILPTRRVTAEEELRKAVTELP